MRRCLILSGAILLQCWGQPVEAQSGKTPALSTGDLKTGEVSIGYPSPAIPFYHIRVDLLLAEPSVIEAEMEVNGKTLRATDLYREHELDDMGRPPLTHRPPSGAGLSQDNTLYLHPTLVGWVAWRPGGRYQVKISVKVKKTAAGSKDDRVLTTVKTVTAPDGPMFDSAWKKYKSVVLSETAGMDRKAEPVEVLLPFYPDEVSDLKRELRVAAFDPESHRLTEVPSQVYDIQEYLKEDNLSPDSTGRPAHQVPIWLPTITARVAFLADVPARQSRIFFVYYKNDAALARVYQTDLRVQGEAPGLQIDNSLISVVLHPNSGHFDQVTLKSKQNYPLFHHKETNGAIHWNPEIYAPPRPWTHTSDWKPAPHVGAVSGPVLAQSEVWGHLRDIPEVDAAVRYEFYPGRPYFVSSTSLRINETVQSIALRNAEIVFKRELITKAAWYDIVRDSIVTYDVAKMPDLLDIKMEADVPWISFYNEEKGIGFAGIRLDYSNAGLENSPRLLNPYFYITGGPWIYWARALSLTFVSSNMQQLIPVLKGNFFSEKWAYLVYETAGDKPYAPVLRWQKILTNPLRMQLVEEVDDRVSRTVTELFVDKGKSGWEGRSTKKH